MSASPHELIKEGAAVNVEQQRREETTNYVRLEYSEEPDSEEFEILQPAKVSRFLPIWWWTKTILLSMIMLGLLALLIIWGFPFLLEKWPSTKNIGRCKIQKSPSNTCRDYLQCNFLLCGCWYYNCFHNICQESFKKFPGK